MCHTAGKSHAEHHNPVLVGWGWLSVGVSLWLAYALLFAKWWPNHHPSHWVAQAQRSVGQGCRQQSLVPPTQPTSGSLGALLGAWSGGQYPGSSAGGHREWPTRALPRGTLASCEEHHLWLGCQPALAWGQNGIKPRGTPPTGCKQQGAMQNQLVWSYENTVVYVWLVSYELKQSSHGLFFKSSSNFYYIKWD